MDYYVNIIKKDENNKNIKINGSYLIERAIEYNDIKSIKYLLSINCNIFIPKLLFNPIKFNKTNIINILTNYSSLIYEQLDNKKHNAFHYAIRFNNNKIIDKLINKINLFDLDIYNNTYLHYAIKYNNEYVINKLLNIIIKNNNLIKILEITNNNKITPIMYIISNNIKFNIILNLFNNLKDNLVIDYNIKDNNNNTILNYILMYYNKDQIIQLFKILINSLSYINWDTQDNNGNTILHNIILNNYDDKFISYILNLLLYKININKYNMKLEIPLVLYLKIHKNINKDNYLLLSNLLFTDIKGNNAIYYMLKYNIDENILKYIYKNYLNNKPINNTINNKNVSLKSLDKNNIFNYKEINNKELNITTQFTTLPFDILCSYIILKALNYNIPIDFNNINYLKSLFQTSLQYLLIWQNKELINKELLNNMIYYKGNVIYFIIINYENINHCNILICNNDKKICYRFDPYGYYYNKMYDLNLLDELLNNFCNKLKYDYSYYNEMVGVQQYEKKNKLYINDLNGYCLSWCLSFAEMYILNYKDFLLENIVNLFNKLNNNEKYYNYKLKNQQNDLSKIRDIILDSLHIDLNEYCNDINNENIIKKIFSELINIFNKYNN